MIKTTVIPEGGAYQGLIFGNVWQDNGGVRNNLPEFPDEREKRYEQQETTVFFSIQILGN